MTDAFNDYRKAWLASAIKGKQDEIAVLTVKTSLEEIRKSLYAIVFAEAPGILETHKQPILNEDGLVNGEELWEVIPHFITVCDKVYADLAIYAACVLAITEASWQTKQLKINKKKSTATAAIVAGGDNVEMRDALTEDDKKLQSTIDKVVTAALAKRLSTLRKRKPGPTLDKKRGHKGKGKDNAGPSRKKSKLMSEAKASLLYDSSPAIYAKLDFLTESVRTANRPAKGGSASVRPSPLQAVGLLLFLGISDPTSTAQQDKCPRSPTLSTSSALRRQRQRQDWRKARKAQRSKRRAEVAKQLTSNDFSTCGNASLALQGASSGSGIPSQSKRDVVPTADSLPFGTVYVPIRSTPSMTNAVVHNPSISNSLYSTVDSSRNRRGPRAFISLGNLYCLNPLLMPDELLDFPLNERVKWLVEHMSDEFHSDLRYQQDIHTSPGVSISKEMAYQISVGAKYMFHTPCDISLIEKAWKDFNRQIRW